MSNNLFLQWTRLLGTSSLDRADALTTGIDGSICIAGTTQGDLDGQTNSGYTDAFLSKYHIDEIKEWSRFFGRSLYAFFHALTTGSDRSIYIFILISWNSNNQIHLVIENNLNEIRKFFLTFQNSNFKYK